MSNVVVSAIFVLMSALTVSCSGIPSADERKVFLSEEHFSSGYKIAVTSVIKEPNVDSVIGAVVPLNGIGMLFRLATFTAEPGAKSTVGATSSPLERIDLAMKASLESHLPVSASFLARSSYGGNTFVPQISNIAFDALQQAKAQGFEAMFFVHLQPALTSVTGFGDRRLSLTGTPVFRSIRTNHLLHFENYRLECAEGRSLAEAQVPAAISACTDLLIEKLKAGLDVALTTRATLAPAPKK